MILLPTTNQKPLSILPKTLAVLGKPKTGKSRIVTGLQNYIILDFEEGDYAYQTSTKKYDSCSICVKPIGNIEKGEHLDKYINDPLKPFFNVLETIKDQGCKYDYIVIDSITKLRDAVYDVATNECKKQNRDPEHYGLRSGIIKDYMRKINDKICNYAKHIIYVGHMVDSMELDKMDRPRRVTKLLVRGNLSETIPSWLDAIGIMETDGKIGTLTFDNADGAMGSRCVHLSGRTYKISELNDDDTLVTFRENIYPKDGQILKRPSINDTKIENTVAHIKNNYGLKDKDEWIDLIKNSDKLNEEEKKIVLEQIDLIHKS